MSCKNYKRKNWFRIWERAGNFEEELYPNETPVFYVCLEGNTYLMKDCATVPAIHGSQ
jgi:hypothetical protein